MESSRGGAGRGGGVPGIRGSRRRRWPKMCPVTSPRNQDRCCDRFGALMDAGCNLLGQDTKLVQGPVPDATAFILFRGPSKGIEHAFEGSGGHRRAAAKARLQKPATSVVTVTIRVQANEQGNQAIVPKDLQTLNILAARVDAHGGKTVRHLSTPEADPYRLRPSRR